MTMLLDTFIVLGAIVFGAIMMSVHENDKASAVAAERRRTEHYRLENESLRIDVAWRDARATMLRPREREWGGSDWVAAEQVTSSEIILDEQAEKELKENGAVVRVRS